MNFVYPERPTRDMLLENLKKIQQQLNRLGIDPDKIGEKQNEGRKKHEAWKNRRKKKGYSDLPDSPTFPMYLILFALSWRFRESQEDPSNVSPRMNPLEILRLSLELVGRDSDTLPQNPKKTKREEEERRELYPRLVYKYLESFFKQGLVLREKIGKEKFVYFFRDSEGGAALAYWETQTWRMMGTEMPVAFIGAFNVFFCLLLKRFLRFYRGQDFQSLERYVHREVTNNLPDDHGHVLPTDEDNAFVHPNPEAGIDNYFSKSPEENLANPERMRSILEGLIEPSQPVPEFEHWPKFSKTNKETNYSLLCGVAIQLEDTVRWCTEFYAALNMRLFWAEIVAALKKRFAGKMVD